MNIKIERFIIMVGSEYLSNITQSLFTMGSNFRTTPIKEGIPEFKMLGEYKDYDYSYFGI